MAKFQVKETCEYIVEVEASSEEEAFSVAQEIPHDEWPDQSWLAPEVEAIKE